MSEENDQNGVVLSVSKSGEISISAVELSAWNNDFRSFSSFDSVHVPESNTVPARSIPKASANQPPSSGSKMRSGGGTKKAPSHFNAPNSHHGAASARRGAMNNQGNAVGVLATFAAGAASTEKVVQASSGSKLNLKATVKKDPETPVQKDVETDKLSPPVSTIRS